MIDSESNGRVARRERRLVLPAGHSCPRTSESNNVNVVANNVKRVALRTESTMANITESSWFWVSYASHHPSIQKVIGTVRAGGHELVQDWLLNDAKRIQAAPYNKTTFTRTCRVLP
ncbi:unnamed protein product, partial [Nesidiocoris tenuis]